MNEQWTDRIVTVPSFQLNVLSLPRFKVIIFRHLVWLYTATVKFVHYPSIQLEQQSARVCVLWFPGTRPAQLCDISTWVQHLQVTKHNETTTANAVAIGSSDDLFRAISRRGNDQLLLPIFTVVSALNHICTIESPERFPRWICTPTRPVTTWEGEGGGKLLHCSHPSQN